MVSCVSVINSDSECERARSSSSKPSPVNVNVNVNLNFPDVSFLMHHGGSRRGEGGYSVTLCVCRGSLSHAPPGEAAGGRKVCGVLGWVRRGSGVGFSFLIHRGGAAVGVKVGTGFCTNVFCVWSVQ